MIEVGNYVRTRNGLLGKVNKIEPKGSGVRYAGEFITDTIIQFNDGKVYERRARSKNIVKHSKNIIDLIELGNFVNKEEIIEIIKQNGKVYLMTSYCPQNYIKHEIKEILTKEQYMQNCYTVEGRKNGI